MYMYLFSNNNHTSTSYRNMELTKCIFIQLCEKNCISKIPIIKGMHKAKNILAVPTSNW
jgi:Na+-translocating ferredoxin:NAD+ oxidoreductase RnfC subunit